MRSHLRPAYGQSGGYPPAINGAALILDPRNRRRPRDGQLPVVQPQRSGWAASPRTPTTSSCVRGDQQLRDQRPVHAGLDLQAGDRDSRPAGPPHLAQPVRRRHRDASWSRTAPPPRRPRLRLPRRRDDRPRRGEPPARAHASPRTTTSTTSGTCSGPTTPTIAHYPYGETPIQDVAAAYGLTAPTRRRPARRVLEHRGQPTVAASASTPSTRRCTRTASWYTGDNVEMAFGQGGTVAHPPGARQRLRDVRERRDALRPRGRGRDRRRRAARSAALPAEAHGPRRAAAVDAQPDPPGAARRREQPRGHRVRRLPRLRELQPERFPVAGKTGTAQRRAGPGAQQLVRRLRPRRPRALRRALRHRPGRLRRRRRGPGRRPDVRLPRAPPGRGAAPADGEHPAHRTTASHP